MTQMLVKGGFYSWDDLVDFFLLNLKRADRTVKIEDQLLSKEEQLRDINIAENAIIAISILVQKFAKHSEDETYYY
jgi:hypothetical protein